MARTSDVNRPSSVVTESRPEKTDVVEFLGQIMSRDEYEMACRNLREYFDLLRFWQEGDVNESSKL